MFERFTKGARDVVRTAVEVRERAGDPEVTEEHLLRALLAARHTPGVALLDALGLSRAGAGAGRREALVRELDEIRRRGGLSRADTEALAGIGIDVDEVIGRAEEEHGVGALAAPRRRKRLGGPFGDGAKRTLEQSLRAALARGDKDIGEEHILLALAAGGSAAGEALAAQGASASQIEVTLSSRTSV